MNLSVFQLLKKASCPGCLFLISLIFLVFSGIDGLYAAGTGKIKINLMGGRVFRLTRVGGTESPLTKWHELKSGHRIRTDPGARVELVFPDRCVMRLGPSSSLGIISSGGGVESVRAVLMDGNLWINSPNDPARSVPVAVASDAAISSTMAGVFRMTVHPDRSMEVKVYDGTLSIHGPPENKIWVQSPAGPDAETHSPVAEDTWEHHLTELQKLVAWPSGVVTKPYRFAAKADRNAWVQWNLARDK